MLIRIQIINPFIHGFKSLFYDAFEFCQSFINSHNAPTLRVLVDG